MAAQSIAALAIGQTAIAPQNIIPRAEVRRQLPHRDTGQDQQFTGVEDTILMTHEDDHFVAILALQLPPPAQRALAGELFMAPDRPGRLGGRRGDVRQAAGQMRARLRVWVRDAR